MVEIATIAILATLAMITKSEAFGGFAFVGVDVGGIICRSSGGRGLGSLGRGELRL